MIKHSIVTTTISKRYPQQYQSLLYSSIFPETGEILSPSYIRTIHSAPLHPFEICFSFLLNLPNLLKVYLSLKKMRSMFKPKQD